MSVTISLSGDKKLDACLRGMPKVLQNNLLQNAHIAAAKPLVEAAKSEAPKGSTGNLKRSIGIERLSIASSEGTGIVRVGPRRKGGFRGFHGHLVEFGTSNRETSDGKSTGSMPANPFMQDAFGMTKRLVEKNIAFQVGVKIAQYMVRTAPK